MDTLPFPVMLISDWEFSWRGNMAVVDVLDVGTENLTENVAVIDVLEFS